METESPRIGELPLVGGHRALDLVNTVTPRLPVSERYEHLQTPADLIVWSRRSGLLDDREAAEVTAAWQDSAAGRRGLNAVKEIRESVYEVLSSSLGGHDIAARAGDELDHVSLAWASAASRVRLTGVPGGTGVARLTLNSPPALLIPDRVARDAVDLLCGIDVTRLGCCPVESGGCGWLFLDHSRNRSRRWCTMADCGTDVKARRLTERRRDARAAGRGHP